MNFENGALAYHFATWGARGSRNRYTFQIHFTDAFLNYEVYDETMTISKFWGPDLTMEEPREIKFTFEKDGENMHHTQIENQDFVFAILDDREPLVTGRDAIQSLRIIWKLYEAEEKGEIADLRGLGFASERDK
jgi:predicted dehydrogenase